MKFLVLRSCGYRAVLISAAISIAFSEFLETPKIKQLYSQNEFFAQVKANIQDAGKECRPISGATDDDINKIKSHDIPSTQTGKCFLACVHKKVKFMNDDATLSKPSSDKFIASVKEFNADLSGQLQEVADVCFAKVQQGGDECQVAYDAAVCFKAEYKARGIPNLVF